MTNSSLTSPTRRRRRMAAMTGVLLLTGGMLAACSGSSDSADTTSPKKETTTTAVKASSDAAQQIADDLPEQLGFDLSEDDSLCFGNKLVDDLGDDRALEVYQDEADLLALPAGEQVTVKDAFNSCVPGESVSESVVGEFYSAAGATGDPDPEVVSCVSSAVDGKTGDILFESLQSDSADAKPTLTLAALEECVPTSTRAEIFSTAFVAEGAPQAQADCMAAELADTITLEELVDIDSTGAVSPEFTAKAQAAQAACV